MMANSATTVPEIGTALRCAATAKASAFAMADRKAAGRPVADTRKPAA